MEVKLVLVCVCVLFVGVLGQENNNTVEIEAVGRELIEQGRTFVHHAVKRFMVILPAIFFKLGVAFTMLLLVTVVAVNNGFIGFLILVVGLSSVLARLQEARRPQPIPLVYGAPHIPHIHPYHHHVFADRSDTVISKVTTTTKAPVYSQPYDYSQDMRYTDVVYNAYPNVKKY